MRVAPRMKNSMVRKITYVLLTINLFFIFRSIPISECPVTSEKSTEQKFFCGRKVNLNCISKEGTTKIIDIVIGKEKSGKIKMLIEKEVATENSILEIKGIGPKTLDRIKKYFLLEPCENS